MGGPAKRFVKLFPAHATAAFACLSLYGFVEALADGTVGYRKSRRHAHSSSAEYRREADPSRYWGAVAGFGVFCVAFGSVSVHYYRTLGAAKPDRKPTKA